MIGERLSYAMSFLSEAITVWLYMDYLFIRKRNNWTLIISFLVSYFILFEISALKNTTLNALTCCTANFMLIRLNYQSTRKAALLHTGFLCFIMAGSEILTGVIFEPFGYTFSATFTNFNFMVSWLVLSKLFYLTFAIVGERVFAPRKMHYSSEPRFMLLYCSLPVASALIAIMTVYLGVSANITKQMGILMLTTTVALLFANLLFGVLYSHLEKSNNDYLTLQLSIQKEQADIAYYEALQEQFENQRILVHDIKRHLSTIDALAQRGGDAEIQSYISELNASLAPSMQARLCTNSILNLLLLRFSDECKAAGVDFQCDVREKTADFLDASSITALYGNLLSNALESAAQSEEKQIELSVTWNAIQSVVVISLVNSCDVEPTKDGHGGFHTRKGDEAIHGIGLRSIRRTVKKYNGVETMYFDSQKKQFHHIIQFPIPF